MLPLSTVVSVSVANIPQGLSAYSLGNLLLISSDSIPSSWGTNTYGVYYSPDQVLTDFGSGSETYLQSITVFSQQPNPLANNGCFIVYPGQSNVKVAFDTIGTMGTAFPFFSGIISTIAVSGSSTMLALANDVQAYQDKILFLSSATVGDITSGFTGIQAASDYNTRCLYYGGTAQQARLFAAAYASRLLGSNLSGSNTAITMQFKNLITINPDETITSTILAQCITAGVDVYIDVAGIPMTYSCGANRFADQIYNQVWLVDSLKVAAFNCLQGVANKIPQTEDGMNLLKAALKQVLTRGVSNGYLAPGTWTSATTFGSQADFLSNILQWGYYIYSSPISQQSAATRNARQAPLIQIAAKEAGAIHSTSILVYINP
jgi:hypothetical protein